MNEPTRSTKRPRLSTAAAFDNVPDIDKVRRQNDLKLQGRFQAIFDKYDRDFSGVGDEIDIRMLEVVVDNGHLAGMQHERDIMGKRKRREQTITRRSVKDNFENDELTSGAKNSETPVPLAQRIVSALAAQDLRFDAHDPASVADLGKSIALGLAQLMRTSHSTDQMLPRQSGSFALAPTLKDEGAASPQALATSASLRNLDCRITSRIPVHMLQAASDNTEIYQSIWAVTASSTPGPEQGYQAQPYVSSNVPKRRLGKGRTWQPWSQEENDLLLQLDTDKSMNWVDKASHFSSRTLAAVRMQFVKLRKGTARGQIFTQGPERKSAPCVSGGVSGTAALLDTQPLFLARDIHAVAVSKSRCKNMLTRSRSEAIGASRQNPRLQVSGVGNHETAEKFSLHQNSEVHNNEALRCRPIRGSHNKNVASSLELRHDRLPDDSGHAELSGRRTRSRRSRRRTDGELVRTPRHLSADFEVQQLPSAPIYGAKRPQSSVQTLSHVAVPTNADVQHALDKRSGIADVAPIAVKVTLRPSASVQSVDIPLLTSSEASATLSKKVCETAALQWSDGVAATYRSRTNTSMPLISPEMAVPVASARRSAPVLQMQDLGSDDELG